MNDNVETVFENAEKNSKVKRQVKKSMEETSAQNVEEKIGETQEEVQGKYEEEIDPLVGELAQVSDEHQETMNKIGTGSWNQ